MDLNMTLDEVIAKSGIKNTLRRQARPDKKKSGGAKKGVLPTPGGNKGTVARVKASQSSRKKSGNNNNGQQQKGGNNNGGKPQEGGRTRRFRKVGTKANAGRAQVSIRGKKNTNNNGGRNNNGNGNGNGNSRRGNQPQQQGAKANRLARGRSNRDIQDSRRKQSTSKTLQQRRSSRGGGGGGNNNGGNNGGNKGGNGKGAGSFNFHIADGSSKLSARFARK